MNTFICTLAVLFALMIAESAADRKRCFCHVYTSDRRKMVKDLGTVDTHRHWLSVGCRRLVNCPVVCDERVAEWTCKQEAECRRLSGGKKVVPHYKASVCKEDFGNTIRSCGCPTTDCMKKCAGKTSVLEFVQCFLGCSNK